MIHFLSFPYIGSEDKSIPLLSYYYWWSKATVSAGGDETRLEAFALNENIFNYRLNWHEGSHLPLLLPPPREVVIIGMGNMKSKSQGSLLMIGTSPTSRSYYRDVTPTKAWSRCVSMWQRWECLWFFPPWSGCCGSSSNYCCYYPADRQSPYLFIYL